MKGRTEEIHYLGQILTAATAEDKARLKVTSSGCLNCLMMIVKRRDGRVVEGGGLENR